MKFSREFKFEDFRFFVFRGNKFSRIWISDFIPGNKFWRISCVVLESYKNGGHTEICFFTAQS